MQKLRRQSLAMVFFTRIIVLLYTVTYQKYLLKDMSKKSPKKDLLLEKMRHSCSHVMAQAVLEMFPEAKLGIGPTIENGFYYDFDLPRSLIPEDLPLIEKKMKHIIKQNQKFVRYQEPADKSQRFFKKIKQNYKIDLIKELKKNGEKKVSFYENVMPNGKGTFVDLCAGPHVKSTNEIGPFKLMSIAGAYWRGSEKNPMLQRIYGVCFKTKPELDSYLKMIKEAKKRDHREVGKVMDLYSFHEEGPGFPFFHPKGMIIKNELESFWRDLHGKEGYGEVSTPIILHEKLWHQSGHFDHYKENMYFTKIDDFDFAVKPMNCPGGILIYNEKVRSYRDLPLRWGELGLVHRHEKSGVLHGLFRVRHFTQDDAHIFCTKKQIKDELKAVIRLCHFLYKKVFGFDYKIELSTRPEKSIGSDEIWELSERVMKQVLREEGIDYELNEGDGAFYGPKFDFHLADCIGRTWQCGTVQLDFSMPERFEMEYIGKDGKRHRPVMIHRVIYGSMERFMGILVEHFAGSFPLWLAPVQVQVIPVSDKHLKFAQKLALQFAEEGLRVYTDDAVESVSKKIRNAELQKAPYMLVIGDKEKKGGKLTVRNFKTKKQKEMVVSTFVREVKKEIFEKRV